MDKYIAELLKTFKRVIIPDFGAFLAMGDEKGTIAFNEFLKFNDGVFLKHIVEKEDLDTDKAMKEILNWVKQVEADLDKGKPVTFEGLGALRKDANGKIQLEQAEAPPPDKPVEEAGKQTDEQPSGGEEVKDEAPVSEKDTAQPDEKKEGDTEQTGTAKDKKEPKAKKPETEKVTNDQVKVEEAADKEGTMQDEVKAGAETPEKESDTSTDNKDKEKTPPKVKPGPVIAKAVIPEEEEALEFDPDEKPKDTDDEEIKSPLLSDKPPVDTRDDEEKKKLRWIGWALLGLIPILLVIIWFLFIREQPPDRMEQMPVQESETEIQKPVETPTQAEEVPLESQPVEETPPVSQDVMTSDQPPAWYVVAGCYEIENNADKMVALLKSKGYNARKFGTAGPLHMVCFDSFDNRQDALKLLREVRWETEPDAWMIRY